MAFSDPEICIFSVSACTFIQTLILHSPVENEKNKYRKRVML